MKSHDWVLLVEDDVVFGMLFCRFWKERLPAVDVVLVKSLAEFRALLSTREPLPRLVIMDQNLPDGKGHDTVGELTMPYHCWSVQEGPKARLKPRGKEQFYEAIEQLIRVANLSS